MTVLFLQLKFISVYLEIQVFHWINNGRKNVGTDEKKRSFKIHISYRVQGLELIYIYIFFLLFMKISFILQPLRRFFSHAILFFLYNDILPDNDVFYVHSLGVFEENAC